MLCSIKRGHNEEDANNGIARAQVPAPIFERAGGSSENLCGVHTWLQQEVTSAEIASRVNVISLPESCRKPRKKRKRGRENSGTDGRDIIEDYFVLNRLSACKKCRATRSRVINVRIWWENLSRRLGVGECLIKPNWRLDGKLIGSVNLCASSPRALPLATFPSITQIINLKS